MADTKSDDEKVLNLIRRRINDPSYYGEVVEGVHTWDAAKIFDDLRTVTQIAVRAIRTRKADDQ